LICPDFGESMTHPIHDLTFLATHRWYIIIMKFMQTYLGYVKDAHTHVDYLVELHLKLTHFYCN